LLSFLLVSCTSGKKKSEEVKEEISELLKDQESNDVSNDIDKKIKTRTYRMKDGTTLVYNLNSKGIVGFDDWNDYTVVNYEIINLNKVDKNQRATRIKKLNYRIANLANTIP